MSDDFSRLIPEVREFLGELAAENSRDWFLSQKPRYDETLKQPAEQILDALRGPLAELAGTAVKPKLFRPQRDVRFSKDKTPYHLHLHMLWAAPGGFGWFFGVSRDYVSAGAGVMSFDKDQLTAYRAAVDGPGGEKLADIIAGSGLRMDSPPLKRVPAPYDRDHPRGDLLRRKSLTLWRDDPQELVPGDLCASLLAAFRQVQPLIKWLQTAL